MSRISPVGKAGHAFESGLGGEGLFHRVEPEAEIAGEIDEGEAIEIPHAIVLRKAALRRHAPA